MDAVLELMGKPSNSNILELRKGFIRNCLRFSQKYLASDQALQDTIMLMNKNLWIEESTVKYSRSHKDVKVDQYSEGINILIDMLDLQFIKNEDNELGTQQFYS